MAKNLNSTETKNVYSDVYDVLKKVNIKDDSFVSKPEIGFWFPLVGSFLTIMATVMATFFNLSGRVDLINQKLDTVAKQQEELLSKYSSVETRYGALALKVQIIETEHKALFR